MIYQRIEKKNSKMVQFISNMDNGDIYTNLNMCTLEKRRVKGVLFISSILLERLILMFYISLCVIKREVVAVVLNRIITF